jgi:hypothetical protein
MTGFLWIMIFFKEMSMKIKLNRNKSDTMEKCRQKIQERLDLKNLPEISVNVRRFDGPKGNGHYTLPDYKTPVDEPVGYLRADAWFANVIQQFKDNYYYLPHNTPKEIPYEVYLIEPLVQLGHSVITGGFNWVIIGTLKNGEKYAAIKDVEVRPMLRGCSLMTLMTQAEITLAQSRGCDFIHTWHLNYNTHFKAAVFPELAAGFMFYRGKANDGEEYEDEQCVHLRYYLDRKKMKNACVRFKGGNVFESPRDNDKIIEYMEKFTSDYPEKLFGKEIVRIEEDEK